MASSYSPSLKLELIGNGDQSGTWGETTNRNLGTLLEQAITGVTSITMANADYTLTSYNGVTDEARNAVLVVGGTNSASRQIIIPLVEKLYVITNNTSGGYAITIGGTTGTTVTIPNGVTAQVYCDGINTYSSQTGSAGNFTVNGTLIATGLTDTGNMTVGGTLDVTGATSLTTGSISGIVTAPTASAGTNTTQLATTAFVLSNGAPTGGLMMWGTGTAPTGWLLCAGAAVSRTTYAALFAVIGTTFGVGDGSTTFNLPNYTDRMPYGTTVGATGGSADAVVVSHTHTATSTVTDPGHSHFAGVYINAQYGSLGPEVNGSYDNTTAVYTGSATTGITVATSNSTTGVSGTNANLPPYLGINFIIKT
jgi:microcystin-dependent protein